MKKGISLIILIITIIVIIILAGVIILNLTNNNPIDSARQAKFVNDIDAFKSELSLYELDNMASTDGEYNPKTLNADKTGSTENGKPVNNEKTITDIITTMDNTRYPDILEVVAGELVYVGDNEKESNWGDGIIESKNFKINLSVIPDMTSITGKVTLSGLIVDESKIEYYKIYLSQTEGTYSDEANIEITDKKKEVEFNFDNLIPNSNYYIKVELKMENESSVRIRESGKIVTKPDGMGPNTPQIVVPEYSNNYAIYPVTVTLTDDEGGSGISKTNSRYIIDQVSTNYSEDNDIWQAGSSEFDIDDFIGDTTTLTLNVEVDGEYYLHVIGVDNAGNKKAAVSSKIIVDTTVPNEAEIVVPQTAINNSIEATVTMSDNVGGSGLNLSECKYIYSAVSYPYGDTESIWSNANAFTNENETITVTSSTNDIYYLHVLTVDKAGNRREVLSSGVTTNTETPVAPEITATSGSNVWTNQNVEVTVNEVTSPGIVKYEYTINGGNWQEYTGKINITEEGVTTIKARAVNNVGTIGAESIGYMVSIDKTAPTVVFGTNGASNVKVGGSTASVSDISGSGTDESSLQYVWSTSTTEPPSSGWEAFTNSSALTKSGVTGTYYLWIKGTDNAGNSIITKSNAFTIDNIAPSNPSLNAIPTNWTNGNVTVTITYPSDASIKQYSTNGTTWNNYTTAITVSTNNTTVYAIAKDAAGNQSGQSTLTVANIDKTAPTNPTVNLNGYASGTWTNGNITVSLNSTDIGSGIQRYQESWNNGQTWNEISNPWIINWDCNDGSLIFRAIDNVGNASGNSAPISTKRDTSIPNYTSYEIKNISSTGYDVYVYGVSDSASGLNRVQFPTWTDNNGQDDLRWETGQNQGNGTWYYRVDRSVHNNESGQYQTHIYIYDNVGNYRVIGTSGAYIQGENIPQLATGMTPIKWDANGNVVTTTASDPDWYNYSSKKWANAMTADGSMWVWIPRYEYRIPTTHSSTAQTILINFIQGTQTAATSGYIVHPAFTFRSTQLTGIWIAKFEATGSYPVSSKPNIASYRGLEMNEIFKYSRNMEINSIFGWGTSGNGIDTHLIKNIEWGAAAYLSQSIYGMNGKISINSNTSYLTGGGNYALNISQSTTGNIYGIYDMSGGTREYVSAVLRNGQYRGPYSNEIDVFGTDKEYIDLYEIGDDDEGEKNYNANSNKIGDAIYETSTSWKNFSSWYGEGSIMPSTVDCWLERGGDNDMPSYAGIFYFNGDDGASSKLYGFRPTIAVSGSL